MPARIGTFGFASIPLADPTGKTKRANFANPQKQTGIKLYFYSKRT